MAISGCRKHPISLLSDGMLPVATAYVHGFLLNKKTKKEFYVFNTHYDYQKDLARNESSKLILKKIKRIAGKNP